MRTRVKQSLPARSWILHSLSVLAMLLILGACGPKPTGPTGSSSPVGGPIGTQASLVESRLPSPLEGPAGTLASPVEPAPPSPLGGPPGSQAPPLVGGAPPPQPGTDDAGNPIVPPGVTGPDDSAWVAIQRFNTYWADVNPTTMLSQARRTYAERSKDGMLQFKSKEGVHQVKIENLRIEGVEPDWSMRMSGRVEVDSQERNASFVVTRDDQKSLHFDTIILTGPNGQVAYVWSEERALWLAQKDPPRKP